jgi:hypothetical protein
VFSRAVLVPLFIFLVIAQGRAQTVAVHGKFQMDSVKIGEAVPFSLTARYPAELNILLPDSSYSFAPFELQRKKYFPTKTINQVSYDSVVYFLATYEIDSIQKLQLPAFVIHAKDCTKVFSNEDGIILKQLVTSVPDSITTEKLPLKTNTDYFAVSWLLNYPLVLIIAAAVIFIFIVLWIIFGKRIRQYFALKRLTKNHADFIQRFSTSVAQFQEAYSSPGAETVFVIWKKYMENLVGAPYTRYTSTEILKLEHDEKLGKALRALNKIIYAGVNSGSPESFMELRAYAEDQFNKKLEIVKHG